MSLSRKNYVAIAAALSAQNPGSPASAANDSEEQRYRYGYFAAVSALVDALEEDNPRFDRVKFYAARGIAEWK